MESIAIIGTGIAGMGCGHFLHKKFDIDFYEQNSYAGGHTNTVYVDEDGTKIPIDTGFIVFNNVTYPNLVRLFTELGVEVKPTDMSFGVQHHPSGLEYSSKSLFAQKSNYLSPRFWRLLFQIQRLYKESPEVLSNEKFAHYSLGDYVKEKKYNEDFVQQYIVPMSSALWSTPVETTLLYPVRVLINFFKNHGMLGINEQFQWYTVQNGSWQYRDKLIAPFKHKIKLNNPVDTIIRDNGRAIVITKDGQRKVYDKVIIASHADQALRMLGDPTTTEQHLLSNFQYQKNIATLHTDESIMPKTRSSWSAWNYIVEDVKGKLVATTAYDMNRLQNVSSKKNYFVSINDPGKVNKSQIIREIMYEHPIFTPETAAAQQRLHSLNDNGVTYFCGSYFRYGFHEDAFTSALQVCERILGGNHWAKSIRVQDPVMAELS
jgi:predicted NAD/FAD-binding protein